MPSNNGTNDPSYPRSYTPGFNPGVLLTAVIVLIIITSVYILLHLCSRYVFGRHITTVGLIRSMSSVHQSSHPRRSGLHPSVISALPVVPFQNPKLDLERQEEGFVECVVCLGPLEEGEKVKILTRCKHFFHADCIDMWLYSHSTCPVCRANAEPESPDKTVGPVGSVGVIMRELDDCNSNSHGKDVGSTSSLGNSFRRIINGVDRSTRGGRTQLDDGPIEVLERQ